MDNLADAATMRQWALRCFTKAKESEIEEEQQRLHKMGLALLEVAETRDWLDGRRSESKKITLPNIDPHHLA